MKGTVKLKKRLEALGLALLFMLQSVLGFLPGMIFSAAGAVKSIEVWDSDQLIDYGYRFNMKFQPGVTTYEPFGCDNLDSAAFSDHGRSTRDTESVRITEDYKSGSAGMRYNNVGRDAEGNIVDVRLTLVGVENAERRYDLRTPVSKKENNGGLTFGWENNETYPMVGFAKNNIGVFIYSLGSAKINFQFLKHGTDEALTISGHGTIRDIDAAQGVSIPSDNGLDHAYVLKNNEFLKVNGTYVGSQNVAIEPEDENGWLNMFFQTDNFNLVFSHQEKLDMWDASREKSIAKAGSQEKWASNARKAYADESGKSYCETFEGQKVVKGFAYFDFTSYCFSGIEMKKAPEKRVGEVGCTWDQATAAPKEQPFVMKTEKEFQYMIQAETTPNRLKSFVISDVLENCLTMDDASKVSVINSLGQDVTEQFDVAMEGQTVICSAKADILKEEAFTDNQTYTFILKVHRKPEGQFDISKYLAEDGYTLLVPNQASMSYERVNGGGDTKKTEIVWVKGIIPPELEVKKNVSSYEWKVGDIIDYSVTVTQTKPDVQAVGVSVTDEIPSCLCLTEGQYAAQTSPGADPCTLTRQGENGWKVTCPTLKYGETITVSFKCQAAEASNGQEWENIVTATADNLVDPETGEQKDRKDMAEVWPNSPQLEIDKTADKYEWQVGDGVTYRIVVNNSVPGTIAKDVSVTDIGLPQGLVLSGGTQSVEVLNVQSQVNYPVPDKKTGQAYESRTVESHMEADESGFAFYCSYLPYSQPVTLVFHCIATESANGHESVNVANVKASNANEKSDDAEVYVNTGSLWIEKTADHYEWKTGEQVEYKVVVENKNQGTIARNVTVWDTEMPAGLVLDSMENVSVNGIPQSITQPVAGTEDTPGQLNPEFYNETGETTVGYEFLPEGNGWRLNLSDLPAGVPVAVAFLCTATEDANGVESINLANVQAENAPKTTDDAEVYVNTAILSIDKGFQNPYLAAEDGRVENEFRVGEQVNYQVTVTNQQKGSIARNLVISDLSLPEGLALDGDEGAVTVSGVPTVIQNPVAGTDDMGNALNPENYGETVEKQVSCQVIRQGTGWIVTISDLPYQLPVTVNFRCTAQSTVNGMEIVNTAKAYADNAAEVKDTSKIWVNSPVLRAVKTADKTFYKYGDIVTWRIDFTQEQTGCVARELVVQDVTDTPGVRLQKDSIVLLDEKGTKVEAQIQANDDNTFVINTGRNLIKDVGYLICDNDRGGISEQVMPNPLECREQKCMAVEYQTAIIDPALAGKKIHNTAVVNSRENIPVNTEAETEVHSPVLEITKTSDKKEYMSGETGYYTLKVRQLREDVTDENIVITDAFQTEGAKIKKESVLVKKNGTVLKDAKTEISEAGFVIHTGTGLGDSDKLEIYYEAVFETAAKDKQTIVNHATARGDLSTEVQADHEIYVKPALKPSPTPTPTPKPSKTPEPTVAPQPTNTPVPTPTIIPKATPTPRPNGTCPKLTQIPTNTPVGVIGGGNNGNSGNGGYGSGGYSSYSSGYQGGYTAGSSKTGESRPFKTMAGLSILGILLLGTGILVFRRSKNGKREKHS